MPGMSGTVVEAIVIGGSWLRLLIERSHPDTDGRFAGVVIFGQTGHRWALIPSNGSEITLGRGDFSPPARAVRAGR